MLVEYMYTARKKENFAEFPFAENGGTTFG